jgi:hypothetical protein
MSVPLDRLYYYIESVAQEIRGDCVIIYRFLPHGSKNVDHLDYLRIYDWSEFTVSPHLYCNDQEPLDYEYYEKNKRSLRSIAKLIDSHGLPLLSFNFSRLHGIYDRNLLLHSEKRSDNIVKYSASQFIPVYYWSHAIIAQDWFRYAEYVTQKKSVEKLFLIYNRAWSGTREYRLGFADRLICNELVDDCIMRISPVDSTIDKHYDLHTFDHEEWRPKNVIEEYFPLCEAESHYSADFDQEDYESTNIEVVLETLFDDSRLHLTEKTLRPIAMGQPFMLAGTYGSLKYLREYGFKTFSDCWDESYDLMSDSLERMNKIIEVMKNIALMHPDEKEQMLIKAQAIADYNKQYFFSKIFQQIINAELVDNLTQALRELEITNTSNLWINDRKELAKIPELKNMLTGKTPGLVKNYSVKQNEIVAAVSKARQYYISSLSNN